MSTTEQDDAVKYAKWTDAHYRNRVETIATGLRRLADDFEREARPHDAARFDGLPRHANAAQGGLHTLSWGLANLHTDQLVTDAAIADAAEVKIAPSSGE